MATLETLLRDAHDTLGEFLAAIDAERRCLNDGDGGTLSATTQRKSALASRLADIDTRRDALLGTLALPAGRRGIEAWLDTLPQGASQAPRRTWLAILERAAKAMRENDVNGRLIAARLQQNQEALGVLLGETGDGGTYGADGQQNTRAGRRPLGSA